MREVTHMPVINPIANASVNNIPGVTTKKSNRVKIRHIATARNADKIITLLSFITLDIN
jgi:hypothetical protein